MGLSVNVTVIAGNLTKDVELRSTPAGKAVCNMTIASNSAKKNDTQPPTFVTIVAWDKTAESCAKYLKKGDGIIVTGRLHSRMWEAKDNTKRSALEVVAESVQFVLKKRDKEDNSITDEAIVE